MDNSVNRIQINTNYQLNNVGEKPEGKAQQKEENNKKPEVENKQVAAGDVLDFMNTQAASVRPVENPRVLNISKYVTPEQAARIGGFISQFENAVADGLNAIEAELGNAISDDAKLDLAVEIFKAENM